MTNRSEVTLNEAAHTARRRARNILGNLCETSAMLPRAKQITVALLILNGCLSSVSWTQILYYKISRGVNLQIIGLSNLVFIAILTRMGSSSGAAPAYPHHSIRSNSCTIRATVYSICKLANTRPRQMRGPMLKGKYWYDVGDQFSHRHGSHVSTSAKPMTASRRCELITTNAIRVCQCLYLIFPQFAGL